MKFIEITGCSNSSMWYASHVGERFKLLRYLPAEENAWLVLASDGFSNIVSKKDGILVEE